MLLLLRIFPSNLLGVILFVFWCIPQIGGAGQFGYFTYDESATSITITGYPTSATGSVVIPAMITGKPVKAIGNFAFKKCSKITSVVIPTGVTAIGQGAFWDCWALNQVTIPNSVSTIAGLAFLECGSLVTLTIPEGVTSIGYQAFYYCGMIDVTLPASVTFIDTEAFASSILTSITVASGNPAYSSLNGVLFNKSKTVLHTFPKAKGGSYVIPNGVTTVLNDSFKLCTRLTKVTAPPSLVSVGDRAFSDCKALGAISLPDGVTSLGYNTFSNTALLGFTIPAGVTTIEYGTFSGCDQLKSVTIPASVTAIESDAFDGCTSLAGVTLPPNLTSIGDYAFGLCSSLSQIAIPTGVNEIGYRAFAGCESLLAFTVDGGNAAFTSFKGVLFDKEMHTLVCFPGGRAGGYFVPFGTETIGEASFMACGKVTSVRLPDTVEQIEGEAFLECSIPSIRIPESVVAIGFGAFYYCDQLTEVLFMGDAPAMDSNVFHIVPQGFALKYFGNHAGFTSPTWLGYPSVDLGERVDTPADISVEQPGGASLSNGGSWGGFETVPVGGYSSDVFVIGNEGTSELKDLKVSLSGTNPQDFQLGLLASTYLPGGTSIPLTVSFFPTAGGTRTASIRISSSDPDESPFEIRLTGKTPPPPVPEIDVSQPAGSHLVDGTSKKSFGTAVVGKSGMVRIFTIKNTGKATLTGLEVGKKGADKKDFTITQPDKKSLPAGKSTTFKVTFSPLAKGERVATLLIRSNDADESPFDIRLSGMGVVRKKKK